MSKSVVILTAAITVAVSGFGLIGAYSSADAATYTTQERINRNVCYRAKRIPATVQYNTRGIKLRNASRNWVGNMQVSGAHIVDQYNDEVYITTRQVIEDQHMTLVQVPCR